MRSPLAPHPEKPPVSQADLKWILPDQCPVCKEPAKGKMLVCERCWWKAPAKDRATFVKLFGRAPRNCAGYRSIGEKIVRNLLATWRSTSA